MSVFERVLVPVDFSECSWAALRTAAELARPIRGQLEVIHAWQIPAFLPSESVVGTVGTAGEPLLDVIQTNAAAAMKDLVERARGENIELAAARVVVGYPTRVILEEAKTGRYDVIVLGTHGRSGFSHALLGSVAEKVVRLSPVPVLTVHHTGVS